MAMSFNKTIINKRIHSNTSMFISDIVVYHCVQCNTITYLVKNETPAARATLKVSSDLFDFDTGGGFSVNFPGNGG